MELFWFVGYVKSCHENRVAETLARRGVETYLPTRKEKRRWSDRTKIVDVKLLPGRIFIHTTKERRNPLLEYFPNKSLYGYMSQGGSHNPVIVPDAQMETFRTMVDNANGQLVRFVETPLAAGDKVRITQGPFIDFECVLVQVDGKKCLGVPVGPLGTAVIEISSDVLERIESVKKQ